MGGKRAAPKGAAVAKASPDAASRATTELQPAKRTKIATKKATVPAGVMNSDIIQTISSIEQRIKDHAVFQGVSKAPPLELVQRADPENPLEWGSAAGFDPAAFKRAIAAKGEYRCNRSIFVFKTLQTSTKKTPIQWKKVVMLKEHFWGQPPTNCFTDAMTFCGAVRTDEDPDTMHGEVQLISPIEMTWSLLLAVDEAIANGEPEEVLLKWCSTLVSVPCRFIISDNQSDRYWKHMQTREDIAQLGAMVKRTSVERGFDVMEAKEMAEDGKGGVTLSASACSELWKSNVRLAHNSEPVKPAFVDAVFTVFQRLMTDDVCKQMVLASEVDFEGAFTMCKLEAVVKRCGSIELIRWTVSMLYHQLQNGDLLPTDLSLRQYTGRGNPGNKGILDLVVAKHEVATFMAEDAKSRSFDEQENHRVCPPGLAGRLDESPDVRLWENTVVGHVRDSQLKACKIAGNPLSEGFFGKSPFKDAIEGVYSELEKEDLGKPRVQGDGEITLKDVEKASEDASGSSTIITIGMGNTSASADELAKWTDYARKIYSTRVKLVVDPGSAQGVSEVIKMSALSNVADKIKSTTTLIPVMYDQKLAGMASARSHIRIVPLREGHLSYMVKGVLKATAPLNQMPKTHAFYILDGTVHGNEAKVARAFQGEDGKAIPKEKRLQYVMSTESSLRKRRSIVRGSSQLPLVEYCNIFTHPETEFQEKDRVKCAGTTKGDVLGPFDVPDNSKENVWHVQHSKKLKMYAAGFIEVGKAVAGDIPEDDPAPKQAEQVPFCYHGNSQDLYKELGHAVSAPGWIDLTCCDGGLALHCIKEKKPYLGFCFSQDHRDALETYLIDQIFKCFQRADDELHEPDLAKLFNQKDDDDEPKKDPAKPKSKPKGKPKGKPKAGAAALSKAELLNKLQELDDNDGPDGEGDEGDEDDEQ
ncbi:unnamed protein product [Prorocentrum cordatum]|uniref:Uncharacterized protein n=1 Tax=Prorocentrum cordatum TaxID=2364126 RepID=A0ABN9S8H6_9DINO|nr:unnamed protein product [Polarella glacialis]